MTELSAFRCHLTRDFEKCRPLALVISGVLFAPYVTATTGKSDGGTAHAEFVNIIYIKLRKSANIIIYHREIILFTSYFTDYYFTLPARSKNVASTRTDDSLSTTRFPGEKYKNVTRALER